VAGAAGDELDVFREERLHQLRGAPERRTAVVGRLGFRV